MNKEELKAKMTGISSLSLGSRDYETADKCMIKGPGLEVAAPVQKPTPGFVLN